MKITLKEENYMINQRQLIKLKYTKGIIQCDMIDVMYCRTCHKLIGGIIFRDEDKINAITYCAKHIKPQIKKSMKHDKEYFTDESYSTVVGIKN